MRVAPAVRRLPVAILVVLLAACGASAQEKAITAAYVTTVSAHAAMMTYDQAHADDVIVGAPDEATGKNQLATWRLKVKAFEAHVDAADHLIAAAAALRTNDAINAMNQAVLALTAELAVLGVVKP